jgi:hypothetical protein
VRPYLERFRPLAHDRWPVAGVALDRQKQLVLLRGDSDGPGALDARAQEPPQRRTERGERAVVDVAQ